MRLHVFLTADEYTAWRNRAVLWHRWYAWWPVWVDGSLVWLEHIERRWAGRYRGSYWQHRMPESQA